MKTSRFKVVGMTCGGCANTVSRAINAMGGVRSALVSFEKEEATVRYDERITDQDKIILAVMSAGYSATQATASGVDGGKGHGKDMASKEMG